jgi:hypothetical protein
MTSSTIPGFNPTTGVAVTAASGSNTFLLTATHANCNSSNSWTFSSTNGLITGPSGGCS